MFSMLIFDRNLNLALQSECNKKNQLVEHFGAIFLNSVFSIVFVVGDWRIKISFIYTHAQIFMLRCYMVSILI